MRHRASQIDMVVAEHVSPARRPLKMVVVPGDIRDFHARRFAPNPKGVDDSAPTLDHPGRQYRGSARGIRFRHLRIFRTKHRQRVLSTTNWHVGGDLVVYGAGHWLPFQASGRHLPWPVRRHAWPAPRLRVVRDDRLRFDTPHWNTSFIRFMWRFYLRASSLAAAHLGPLPGR